MSLAAFNIADSPAASIGLSPESRGIAHRLFDRKTISIAWLALLVAIVHPPHETGISLCWLHSWTGIQCPGCGITRSMSCAVRGLFRQSWEYHPFGIPILLLVIGIAAISTLSARRQASALAWLTKFGLLSRLTYFGLVSAFLAFGTIRAIGELWHLR